MRTLLLSALDLISERRMDEYGLAFEAASTAPELARLARRIYDEEVERGNITVLGEMVPGGCPTLRWAPRWQLGSSRGSGLSMSMPK